MKKNVAFEGKIRIEGSIQTVEKVLAKLARENAVTFDRELFPDPPFPGIRESELQAIMTSRFVSKQVSLIKRKASRSARLSIAHRLPDSGINGGRKYRHVHFDNYILPVDSNVYNQLFLGARIELNKLSRPNEIPG